MGIEGQRLSPLQARSSQSAMVSQRHSNRAEPPQHRLRRLALHRCLGEKSSRPEAASRSLDTHRGTGFARDDKRESLSRASGNIAVTTSAHYTCSARSLMDKARPSRRRGCGFESHRARPNDARPCLALRGRRTMVSMAARRDLTKRTTSNIVVLRLREERASKSEATESGLVRVLIFIYRSRFRRIRNRSCTRRRPRLVVKARARACPTSCS